MNGQCKQTFTEVDPRILEHLRGSFLQQELMIVSR